MKTVALRGAKRSLSGFVVHAQRERRCTSEDTAGSPRAPNHKHPDSLEDPADRTSPSAVPRPDGSGLTRAERACAVVEDLDLERWVRRSRVHAPGPRYTAILAGENAPPHDVTSAGPAGHEGTMPLAGAALAMSLVLGADPAPGPARSPPLLPRSSIAAVLERRGELGLDDAEVKLLEGRDAALQKQLADLRGQLTGSGSQGKQRSGHSETTSDGSSPGSEPPPVSPTAEARPEREGYGGGGGGHHGEGGGHHKGHGNQDAAARTAGIQEQMDAADTAAWLAAESLLREAHRGPARDVAEKYRETLADEREKARAGH